MAFRGSGAVILGAFAREKRLVAVFVNDIFGEHKWGDNRGNARVAGVGGSV